MSSFLERLEEIANPIRQLSLVESIEKMKSFESKIRVMNTIEDMFGFFDIDINEDMFGFFHTNEDMFGFLDIDTNEDMFAFVDTNEARHSQSICIDNYGLREDVKKKIENIELESQALLFHLKCLGASDDDISIMRRIVETIIHTQNIVLNHHLHSKYCSEPDSSES